MALRKFVFLNVEYFQEQAANDELQLGKLSLSGVGGIALDGGGARAFNFADPSVSSDLATKQYVDNVAAGIDVRGSCRVATTANLSVIAAGSGVGKTLTATLNGAISIDGVALALANRVLVKNQATGADNGIYTVTQVGDGGTPYILTRATDADTDAEVTAGLFTFVTEGATHADTGWVLVTDDPITVDTTALTFSQFSSTVSYTYDQGLVETGGSIKIDLDTAADAQSAGAAGGSSGLEFDVNTAAGKLRAAVHATGGLERTATGLAAKLLSGGGLQSAAGGLSILIDDTPDTLDVDVDGLKVVGLPSLFKINNVNVSANVTAANLSTLTGGGNADALHVHAKTNRLENSYAVDEAISVADPVAIATVNDRIYRGRADNDVKARIVGVATSAQAVVGNPADFVSHGVAAGVLVGAVVGTPYYLQSTGGLGTASPGAGERVIQVGIAKNATDLFVRIVDYGKKAA